MKIHIGELIRKRAKELRIGPTELAQMINTSRSNIYWIYKRKHIDGEMLVNLSRVLDLNFFNVYTDSAVLNITNLKTETIVKTRQPYETSQTKEMNHLYQEVAELKEKYLALAKSLQKKGKKK
jgi:hypothetical protein